MRKTVRDLQTLWGSGFVNRWHTHHDVRLRNAQDTTAAHQQRVAVLYYFLFDYVDSADVPVESGSGVWSCLVHDAPEVASGDISYGFKRANPEMQEWLHTHDNEWFVKLGLVPPADDPLLKLCDHLDSVLFVRRHAPDLLEHHTWVYQMEGDLRVAEELGIYDIVHALLYGHPGYKERDDE